MATPLKPSADLAFPPVDCFSPVAARRGSVWLDSSLTRDENGRYSYLATNPIGEIVLRQGRGRITSLEDGRDCDLGGVLHELEMIRVSSDRRAIGFIGYEATLPFLGVTPAQKAELPDVHFFIYDRVLAYDHALNEYSDPERAAAWRQDRSGLCRPTDKSAAGEPSLHATVSHDDYLERVMRIKHHIHEGDIYQANFTCRFDCLAALDPFTAFLRLRRLNPCWHGAYLNFGEYQVLSSSPERMFCWEGDRIVSCPIKGTIALGSDASETERNVQTLLNSAKDRAELLMIVDLVRNDLGKIAQIGSVRVEHLYRPEVHSSLIHLVADVAAKPTPGCTFEDVVTAVLPGGSITGAPKKRAVEILQQLELTSRSVYTGCIGYLGGGTADFNIAIRTMIHQNCCYRIHAGGGIVADSDPAAEYEEMLLKARNLFYSLGFDL